MKVCILTPELLPAWGGVGTYAYNLARGLRDQAEVHVLTGAVPSGMDGELDGVRVHRAFDGDMGRRNVSPFRFQVAVFRRLPALARNQRFDLVHANHAYMSDLLVRLRRISAASVVTIHTTLDTQVRGTVQAGSGVPRHSSEGNVARWRFLLQAIERRYLRQTPAMIFVSRWVRDRTLRSYGIHPRLSAIVHNAVDAGFLSLDGEGCGVSPRGASGAPTLLFAGRLLALKGIHTLLRAAARLDPRVRVLLAGPGDQAPWKALARDLGLGEDRCEFLGRVPYADMPRLYRRADAVVLPSFTESCPMVALEAMACGTPIIAADAGGVREIVRDEETGWLFPPGDVDALVSRVEAVLGDPVRTGRACDRARAWVEANASVDRMADQTLDFYERLLWGEAS